MRIVIMGTGGLGGYFGALLARAGGDVTFIARGANLQALQEHGLTVQSVNGDFTLPVVQACADPAGMPEADFVLFCVKTYGAADAAALLQPMVGPNTILLTLQNGVDTPTDLQQAFGRGTVLAGITRIGSTLVEPGVIEQPTRDRGIEFGSLDAQGDAAPRTGAYPAGGRRHPCGGVAGHPKESVGGNWCSSAPLPVSPPSRVFRPTSFWLGSRPAPYTPTSWRRQLPWHGPLGWPWPPIARHKF